jgi:hypothetical protein
MKTIPKPGDLVLDKLTSTFKRVRSVHADAKGYLSFTVDSDLFEGYRTPNDITLFIETDDGTPPPVSDSSNKPL